MVDHDDLRAAPEVRMRRLLAEVAADLVHVDVSAAGEGLITLPMVYPGGAPVLVLIRRDGDDYVVTDRGSGYVAADLLGGARMFANLAPTIAELYGVRYDGDMMFAAEVSRAWLANAVIFTGSASRLAVERTTEKLAVEQETSYRKQLKELVLEAFPHASFDVTVAGRSTHAWKFAAQAELPNRRRAVFDIVTPHPNSVAAAYTKFDDVTRLEDGIDGVAVAPKALAAADRILIGRAAHSIVDLDAGIEAFRRAA